MLVRCESNRGEIISVALAEMVSKSSWLSGARLVPPMNLISEFIRDGKLRFDHWREIYWNPFEISVDEYLELKNELIEKYKFRDSDYSNFDQSRFFWNCVQTSIQTGLSVSDVVPILKKLDILEKMANIVNEDDDGLIDQELSVAINDRINIELAKLQ